MILLTAVSRSIALAVVGAGAASTLLGASASWAQDSASSIRWSAPTMCPSRAALTVEVERFLGQSFDTPRDQVLAVAGTVEAVGQGYSAELSITSADGTSIRRLEHPDCKKLTEAAALVIAIAIDPERALAIDPAVSAPADGSPQPVASVATEAAQPTSEPAPPPRAGVQSTRTPRRVVLGGPARSDPRPAWSTTIDLRGTAGVGLLPRAYVGFVVEPGLELGQVRLAFPIRRWPAQDQAVADFEHVALELDAWTGGARLCRLVALGSWHPSFCAGPDVVTIRGQGEGVESPKTPRAIWGALTVGASVAFEPPGRLRVTGGLDGTVHFARPPFGVVVDDEQVEGFRPEPFAGVVGLGLGGRFN